MQFIPSPINLLCLNLLKHNPNFPIHMLQYTPMHQCHIPNPNDCPSTLGSLSCCVLDGRVRKAASFLHSYVQWPTYQRPHRAYSLSAFPPLTAYHSSTQIVPKSQHLEAFLAPLLAIPNRTTHRCLIHKTIPQQTTPVPQRYYHRIIHLKHGWQTVLTLGRRPCIWMLPLPRIPMFLS